MERETKEIKLENGKVFRIKTYLTEYENRELLKAISNSVVIKDGEATQNADTETMIAYQDKLIELYIVDIDGSKENMLDTMLNMSKKDFKAVLDEIYAINNDNQKKTN